jgi:hypothetical protein
LRERRLGCIFDVLNGLPGRPEGVRQRPEIHQRGPVAVALLVPGPGGRVPHHRDLEPLLQEIAQVGLDTDVARRAGQDDLLDAALAQLEDERLSFSRAARAQDRQER